MGRRKTESVAARARAYYAFQNLPLSEIVCAGERNVPEEPPDEYYLSIGAIGQEEVIQHWLSRRRWSQRLVVGQLAMIVLAALGFGEIFDISSCRTCSGDVSGDDHYDPTDCSCPTWKEVGFFGSVAMFVVCFLGSIMAACNVRLAQSKLDQIHSDYYERTEGTASENSVSVSSRDTERNSKSKSSSAFLV